ncbi:hypothetical protein WME89_21640 [Sorangium sp. So ce321]|uniref:hypothetical protein n=1 Tax=Sorangium sp. So ce321 TaxID=3133300 RepID=UPI003F626421
MKFWWGATRLVLEEPRFCGVMQISAERFRVRLSGAASHATPIVFLISRGHEAALLRSSSTPIVRCGSAAFMEKFDVHAPSRSSAELAFPSSVQGAVERLAAALGVTPEPESMTPLESIVVELLESDKERQKRTKKLTDFFQLGMWGNHVSLDISTSTRVTPDHIAQLAALLKAFVIAASRLEHEFDRDVCRYCYDVTEASPKRTCGRCGAAYHERCLVNPQWCPVWGCGDRQEQIREICAAYGWEHPSGYYKWWLGSPGRELPEAPKD